MNRGHLLLLVLSGVVLLSALSDAKKTKQKKVCDNGEEPTCTCPGKPDKSPPHCGKGVKPECECSDNSQPSRSNGSSNNNKRKSVKLMCEDGTAADCEKGANKKRNKNCICGDGSEPKAAKKSKNKNKGKNNKDKKRNKNKE